MEFFQNFSVQLFGPFQAKLNGAPLTTFYSTKAQALLAYLLVEANHPHSRDFLATLLWGNQTSQRARTNLRATFAKLRNLLAPLEAEAPLFITTRQTIQLNLNPARHWVDAVAFTDLLTGCEGEPVDIPACAQAIAQAVALYQGEFLSDLWVENAETFEAWRLEQQERYHVRVLSLLNCLAGYHLQNTHQQLDYQLAEQYAHRQLRLEPWSEIAHCQLIKVLAKTGQHTAALAQYETCRHLLAEELDTEPSLETVALVEQIRRGEMSRTVEPQTPPQLNWAEVPLAGTFFGRSNELAQLQQWLVEDRCRLVTILGIGGLGKTSLAVQVARAVAGQFEAVIWRSLLNAPTLDELLPDVLQALSGIPVIDQPDSLAEKLAFLLNHLRQHRCLLVLDNLETILQSDLVGQYRSGYEDYGRLVETLAQHEHQSCLLLTSREQPQSRWLMRSNLPGLQTLALSGLDLAATHQILEANDLTATQAEASRLASRYSGNPLALNLVAQTIQDLYLGDVEAFLTEETLIFADIRDVLDKQFNRLSALEQDILLWLAVAREPMFPPDLTAALVRPVRQRELLETLRSLQQRSLLERSEAGFILQNVVTEYLTDILVERVSREIENGEIKWLNHHALLQAQAKTYVRHSQSRLILQPIAEWLTTRLGLAGVDRACRCLLDQLRQSLLPPGYAAGNILNLLLHVGIDVTGYDFSGLSVWQANLQGQLLPAVNFSGSDLHHTIFSDVFDRLYTVTFSPDGQLLVAGASNGIIRLWHGLSGQPMATLTDHTQAVWSTAFSPDGQILASAGAEGVIFLWDVIKGQLINRLVGHESGVHSVAFSPDGQTLASGSSDQTVRLWAIPSGQEKHALTGHTNNVQAVAVSSDGQTLVSAGRDQTVRLWDLTDGIPRDHNPPHQILHGHNNWIYAVAISPDNHTLASADEDGIICLWDIPAMLYPRKVAPTPRQILKGHTAGVQAVAFSPDGQRLASGSNDQTVRLWDVSMGQTIRIFQGHRNWVRAVGFNPAGQTLASAGWDQTVRLWDVDRSTDYLLHTFAGHSNLICGIDFNPNGSIVATAHSDNRVRVWDVSSGQIIHTLTGHQNWVFHVAFSPAGQTLASSSFDHTIRLWDTQTWQLRHILQGHQDYVQGIAFSPDSETLASGSIDRTICLWDLKRGERKRTLNHHSKWVNSVAFSPDGKILASGSADQSVILWDIATGQIRHILEGHSNGVQNVAFSPDGNLLATSSWDNTVRLWHVSTGKTFHVLHGHTNWCQGVAFSPDGATLVSSSYDQTVRLWDVQSGRPRQVLHGHDSLVLFATFSPNGQIVASSGNRNIRLWNPHTGECLQSWQTPGPYEGMNISGVTGITEAQRSALKALGAVE